MSKRLKWTNHHQNIGKMAETLQHSSADVNFVIDGEELASGNIMVISASSSFLYSLLKTNTSGRVTFILADGQDCSSLLKSIKTFIHTGEMIVNEDDTDKVLAVANQLQLKCFPDLLKTQTQDTEPNNNCEVPFKPTNKEEKFNNSSAHVAMNIIDDEEFKNMKNTMTEENLKLVDEDNISYLKCELCGKKWLKNSRVADAMLGVTWSHT